MQTTDRRIVFRCLTPLGLVFALIYRLRGYAVEVLRFSPGLEGPLGRSLIRRGGLKSVSLGQVFFESDFMASEKRQELSSLVMETLYSNPTVFKAILPLFKGISDHKAIRVVVQGRIHDQLEDLALLLTVAKALSRGGEESPLVFAALNGLERLALRLDPDGIRNLCPWLVWGGERLFQTVGNLLRPLMRRDRTLRSSQGSTAASPNPASVAPHIFRVLFFPHQGPAYGNLFVKDYYYDPDPDSPLARNNVLHVEYGQTNLRQSLDYYRSHGLHHVVLPRCPQRRLIKHIASSLFGLAFRVGWLRSVWEGNLLVRLAQLAQVIVAHRFYREATATFYGAQLAIAGYDFLFPRSLALALQSRRIKVVAAQERFIQSFFPGFAVLFDLYFVTGQRVVRQLAENPLCRIGTICPIGCTRSDLLTPRATTARSEARRRVLVLDFHSPLLYEQSRLNTIVNWENNKAFYQDIIRLARRFPEARFTIRGKNDNWCSLPFFANVKTELDELENIEISHNYKELYISYKLANESDLILARHTSLGDEALAVGLPVLFHDFAPNCPAIVSNWFDYDGYPLFVHDYEELERRMETLLAGDPLMPPEAFKKMREDFYNGESGLVCARLIAKLRELLDETPASSVS